MINTSQAYKNALLNDQRSFIRKATIYLADGTELSITDADILQGGFKFDAATSSSGSFDIGAVVIQKFTMRINNIYDTFSIYDFYDAVIWSYAGMKFEDGSEEWFRKGVFTVKEPTSTNSVLSLTCYDNIHKFDIAYSNSTLAYPATRKQIVADICNICGVTNNTGQFDGCDEIVETRPEDTYTCRDILSFIAQICGLYGYCDNAGAFCFGWYNTTAFDDIIAGLDGGNLKDYTSGDTADGGDFTDYTSGDTVDGGDFEDDRNYHHIYSTSSSNVSTDDVTITGIKVTVVSEQSNDDEESTITAMEYFSGETGYVLSISDNPLITTDNGQDIADHLFAKIGNMTFRPMNLSALGDPSMEAGDAMVFTDRKGNSYFGYMTTLSYAIGQYATLVCDAEAPLSRKKYSETYSAATQKAIQMQQTVKKEATRYSQAVNNMSQLAMNSLGFYQTTETLSNGSQIVYMHDKPALEDSQTIYKRTIDGFFVSQDGGNTYTSGFDSSGNAVLNVLSVIGINFDWAYGGTLTLGGNDNVNGVLNIVDTSGEPVVVGNKDGLTIYKGTISFTDITDSDGNTLESRLESAADSGGLTETQITTITKNTIKTAEITANQITSGVIKSQNYEYDSGNFSTAGTCLDLSNGILRSVNFLLGSNGESYFSGNIISESGQIGGFNITSDSLYNGCTSLDSTENGVYIGTMGIRTFGDDGSITIRDYLLEAKTDNDARSVVMTGTGINIFACTDEESLYTNGISFYLDDKRNAFIDERGCFSTQTAPDYSYYGFYWESGDAFLNELKLNDALYMGDWSDSEKNIYFTNLGDGKYQHNCKLYGGNGASRTGIGFYDSLYSRGVWVYDDVNNLIISDATLQYVDVTVTVNSTNASEVTYSAKAFPFLRFVVFHARFTVNEITSGVTTEIGTISSSYAPANCLAALSTWVNSSIGATSCGSHITTDGSIRFHFRNDVDNANLASGKYVYVAGVWTY